MKLKNKNLLDIINNYDWAFSILLAMLLIIILKCKIMIFYDTSTSIIDNIISVFGTLFGFILSCLSIFIVFKTDDKYINPSSNTNSEALNSLLCNKKFNDIYVLFIKNLFSLGAVLLSSFILYFISDIAITLKIIFITIYTYLICLSVLRTLLSLLAFKKLINIIIINKKQ